MGPTTVTWPDWGTGSNEIMRIIVMIRIFGCGQDFGDEDEDFGDAVDDFYDII